MSTTHTPSPTGRRAELPARPGAVSFNAGGKRAAMKMYDLEVSIGDGQVHVSQKDCDGECITVVMAPEQAELACKWIMDAARSLVAREGNANA